MARGSSGRLLRSQELGQLTLNDKDAKSLLSGSATQGYLTLTCAKDAPPAQQQQAVVVAHVALNFVMKWTYASRPVAITVEKPSP